MKSIAVFCASGKGADPIYTETAFRLGALLAERGIRVIYGGAKVGAMGAVAEGAISKNGEVIGVLPHFLSSREIAQENLTELIMVDSMHERKLKMNELCDGVITLPGGFGTMEEFFEVVTWGQLGLHEKPVGILNVNHYYDHLMAQLQHMNREKLLKDKYLNMLLISEKMEALLELMDNYNPPPLEKWLRKDRT